jgi:hypothetical protein
MNTDTLLLQHYSHKHFCFQGRSVEICNVKNDDEVNKTFTILKDTARNISCDRYPFSGTPSENSLIRILDYAFSGEVSGKFLRAYLWLIQRTFERAFLWPISELSSEHSCGPIQRTFERASCGPSSELSSELSCGPLMIFLKDGVFSMRECLYATDCG